MKKWTALLFIFSKATAIVGVRTYYIVRARALIESIIGKMRNGGVRGEMHGGGNEAKQKSKVTTSNIYCIYHTEMGMERETILCLNGWLYALIHIKQWCHAISLSSVHNNNNVKCSYVSKSM